MLLPFLGGGLNCIAFLPVFSSSARASSRVISGAGDYDGEDSSWGFCIAGFVVSSCFSSWVSAILFGMIASLIV
jgi:hypothetical protein